MHELLAVCLVSLDRDSLDRDQDTRWQPSSSAQAQMMEAMQATLDRRYVEHDSFELFQAVMKGAKAFYEWRAEEGPVSTRWSTDGIIGLISCSVPNHPMPRRHR